MTKQILQTNPSTNSPRNRALLISAAAAILTGFAVWTITSPRATFSSLLSVPTATGGGGALINTIQDSPETSYTIDKPMTNWDEKRRQWLNHHPTFAESKRNSVIVVTGSHPSPCKNPLGIGDHLLLRLFKNKVDYCRIHGYEIFYNNAFLDAKMGSLWPKIPVIRAAMLAHPEKEWVFWVDSDAVFTNMDFEIPFDEYEELHYNFIVHGWPDLIYAKKSWLAVNAGVFLIRNCQWSMNFLDAWADMGPKSPDYHGWGKILKSELADKMHDESDDQSALVYLLLKGEEKWREKIYVENRYSLNEYWLDVVNEFDEHAAMESGFRWRQRHAEAVRERYVAAEEGEQQHRPPFVTHFSGCEPCTGNHNPAYEADSCYVGMERALNLGDNQVLRNYGFVHPDINNCSYVAYLPFD